MISNLPPIPQEKLAEFLKQNGFDTSELKAALQEIKSGHLIYNHVPVSLREFIENPSFLNKKGVIYPKVMTNLLELNSGQYTEAVLTGGIGTGKTSIAIYTNAYQLYLLSCMENPHAAFGLDPSSELIFLFQSLSESLAKLVDYDRFRSMIEQAPYFRQHFRFNAEIKSELRFPNNITCKPIGGSLMASLGQNVIGGLIDEVNFMEIVEKSKKSDMGGVYDQAEALYQNLAIRRKTRFLSQGTLPGIFCIISSSRYPGQFTDRKKEEAKKDPTIFVYDKRVWDIKPEGTFSKNRFQVFVGDDARKPRILHAGEDTLFDKNLITTVPEEFHSDFEKDIYKSLKDIAGISTRSINPFIMDIERVKSCFGLVKNIAIPFSCDFVDEHLYLHQKRFTHPLEPRFVHIDLGQVSDCAGLAIGHIPGFMNIDRSNGVVETLPIISFDLVLQIRPPVGGEIQFEKIRALLIRIRDLGLPLQWVTLDSWQSVDTIQILKQRGFVTGRQSVDLTVKPYDFMKRAFYDQRLLVDDHPMLYKEVINLQHDSRKNKIDHPPNGSKDIADAVAGVVYGLSMRRELWFRHNVPQEAVANFMRSYVEDEPLKTESP